MPEVLALLAEFHAKATFFIISGYVQGHEDSMHQALREGHELGNHGCTDKPYDGYGERIFGKLLLEAEQVCDELRASAGAPAPRVPWFRAPHAKLSGAMERVLQRHGYRHVLGDAYANDPWIRDHDFIIEEVLAGITHGSIIVVHMPERGFRRHTYFALRGILQGLQDRNFRAVNLTTLDDLARGSEAGLVAEREKNLCSSSAAHS